MALPWQRATPAAGVTLRPLLTHANIACVVISTAALLLAGSLSKSFTSARTDASPASLAALNPSVHTARAGAAGVTGRVFKGEKVRSFSGRRLFARGDETLAADAFGKAHMPTDKSCARWGVMTTIHEPGAAVIDLARQEGWCIVVVGDESTPAYPKLSDSFVYLDKEAQLQFAARFERFMALLPWRHFGRKNVGYLYAVLHGAEMVWDFDDDNVRRATEDLAAVPTQRVYLVAKPPTPEADDATCRVFNPYPHMGAPTKPSWPRGLPLHAIKRVCNHTLTAYDGAGIAVLQSLANNEPDVDGIFRLTQPIPFDFAPSAQRTLVVSTGVLTPYNAQAQLTLQPALWTLLLPVTVHGRVSDIWRSYFAQRLMWDAGLLLAFTPPRVDQFRNPHDALADMAAEDALYFKAPALTRFLAAEWRSAGTSLPARMEDLLIQLYERDYIDAADVELTQQWILALHAAGYSFPPLSDTVTSVAPPSAPPVDACAHVTRVFVTGVSGMIGSHVTRVLVDKPCTHVYGLVRPRSNLDTLVGVLERVRLVVGDITDAPRMLALMEEIRPDFVYHFAAQAINGISYSVPELTMHTNVQGTLNLLEALRRASLRPRVLLAGSSTEYGRTADVWDGPIPETAPLAPVSPYGVSKVSTEQLGNQYWLSFGIPVVTARFFIQVGVGGTDSLAIHQFAKQIALAEAGLADGVVRHGNIDTKRDVTDARDSAPVVVHLAEKGQPGEAYNVGSGAAVSTAELLRLAVAEARVPIITAVDPSRFRVYDEKLLLADIAKLRALTGWTPSPDMSGTVRSIVEYWRRRVSVLYDVSAKRGV